MSSSRYPQRALTLAGTIFFTLALKYGNPTVVNVILNIQPVISTIGAFVLFGDRLARQFFLYVGIAIVPGIFVSVAYPAQVGVSFERAGLNLSLKTCFSNLHGLWHNPFTQLQGSCNVAYQSFSEISLFQVKFFFNLSLASANTSRCLGSMRSGS